MADTLAVASAAGGIGRALPLGLPHELEPGLLPELGCMTPAPGSQDPLPAPVAGFGPMIGRSQCMQALYRSIARVAPTEATVLIVGESGTGKELVAQSLYQCSQRSREAFVALNCGAVPENLIESELFGHEKGSFTGAMQQRKGVFERATGGTLFLDEITEMPLELQVRLLRVLESGRFLRVGGEDEVCVNVRVVAATNRDPHQAVSQGRLREDLLYRLSVFPIWVPPLRQREGDIELLASHFLQSLNDSSGQSKRLLAEAVQEWRTRSWPGNVRQFRNAIQSAYILAGDEIGLEHVRATVLQPPSAPAVDVGVGRSIAEMERSLIHATLRHCRGNKRATAHMLGISLKTLYNRLNAYASEKPAGDSKP